MKNWKKLRRLIPNKVLIKNKVWYHIYWTDKFDDDTIGITESDKRHIVIKKGMSDQLTVVTYLHECLHAFSDENEIKLTESQILKMEKMFYYILQSNNIFRRK